MIGIDNSKFYTYLKYIVFNIYGKLQDERVCIAVLNIIVVVVECTGQAVNRKVLSKLS